MKVIITGGGTGGHIHPALAIANLIEEKGYEIYYVGSPSSSEEKAATDYGYDFIPVQTCPLNAVKGIKKIKSLYVNFRGFLEVIKILKRINPQLVVGTGGYVSGVVVLAARFLNIKTIIHEQNAVPGMTNRWLAPFVDHVMITFPYSQQFFKKYKALSLVGLPVRTDFFHTDYENSRKKLGLEKDVFFVFVVGGSNGAMKLNEILLSVYEKLKNPKVRIVHGVGKRYYSNVKEKSKNIDQANFQSLDIRDYIDDMPTYLSAADLVISRAGAATIFEVIAVKAHALIVPSPNVTDNHQFYNAMIIEELGLGKVIEEKHLLDQVILDFIRESISKKDKKDLTHSSKCKNVSLPLGDEVLSAISDIIESMRY